MQKTFRGCFNIFFKFVIHIFLLLTTAFVFLIIISDLLFPRSFVLVLSASFLVLCIMIAFLCLYGIWETTSSQLRMDRLLFGFNMAEARHESSKNVIYFYSIMNVYFIFNTTIVVGLWFMFPDYLSRAEPLAYILTILSALSGYSTRVIKQRLDALEPVDTSA